jgi:hypothetical protein
MSTDSTTTPPAPVSKPKMLEVPLDDSGNILDLPDQIKALIGQRVTEAKRAVKASTLADPLEQERYRQMEAENQAFKVADAERQQKYEEALKLRESEYAKERDKLAAEIARRDRRLSAVIASNLRATALEHGARTESAAELSALLAARVVFDADFKEVVLGDDGKPSDLTVSDLVKTYIEAHPHHRAVPSATGGGARGGASTAGGTTPSADRELAALGERYAQHRDRGLINELFEASRKKA